jgi:glycosyltransferase involved in cell wall biosynthesis
MEKLPKKLVIIIPAFNEEKTIGVVLENLPKHIEGVSSIETVVLDDGSNDKTLDVVKDRGIEHVVTLQGHKGLGIVFKEGLKYACKIEADIVVNIDADNQYRGNEISELIKPILDEKADMTIGNRKLFKISGYPIYKLISQSIGNFLVSKLVNSEIKDATSGFRALTRESAEFLVKNLKGNYTYTLESICIMRKAAKVISFVPININYPTRQSRLITNKFFYVRNFFSILLKYYFSRNNYDCITKY